MFLKERQTACKPGSVPPEEVVLGRGWPFLWDARCRAPRATDPSGGAKVRPAFPRTGMPAAPTWSCSRWGFPCRRRCRRRGALLPHRFTLAGRPVFRDGPAVYFLWHFPWGRPRRALPGTVPPWSPDFPLAAEAASGHPAVWHYKIWEFRTCLSKPEGTRTQTAAWDFMGCTNSAARGRIGIVLREWASMIAASHPRTVEKGERHVGSTRYGRLSLRGQRQLGEAAAGDGVQRRRRRGRRRQERQRLRLQPRQAPDVRVRPRRQFPALVGRGHLCAAARGAHGAGRHDLADRRRRPHGSSLHPRRQGALDDRNPRQARALYERRAVPSLHAYRAVAARRLPLHLRRLRQF